MDAVGIGLGLLLIGVPLVLPLALFVFFGAFILAGVAGGFVAVPLVAMASAAGNELRRRHTPA